MFKVIILFLSLIFLTSCGPNPIMKGNDGAEGPTGEQGSTGSPGLSCTVIQEDYGALIYCPDGSSAVVMNGVPASTGNNKKGKK